MATDTNPLPDMFFSQSNCSRCDGTIGVRQMSWFTDECLCVKCIMTERVVRTAICEKWGSGADLQWEGCRICPTVEEINEMKENRS